jgi:DNA-binding transcriptional regulator YhcF (GntR family)
MIQYIKIIRRWYAMIIKIDDYSDVPIYMQIRNQIVMGISSGELSPGEQLPTVRALAMEIGINTMTVSKTYQLLKTEGYILTDRKNGARVREMIEQSGKISNENKTDLRRIVSEARLSGVPLDEIINLVKEYY